jgi:phosphatidylinositol alpha-1,6-mannosyltransferase
MSVIVTNDFPPNSGGIQRTMSLLAQELAQREKRVVVVAPQAAGSRGFDAHQAYRLSRYPGKGRIASLLGMVAHVFWVRLTTNDPLTIASMWFPGGLAAFLVPRSIRGRLAILAHGTEIAPTKGGLRRRLMRAVFDRADVILANSTFTRDLLVQAGVRGRIVIVHPGIDAVPIAPARADVPTIVSVGRLIARKGFDTMIAAMPAVLEKFPNARYEIVGSGPQRTELEALAERLNVRDHVIFLGAVSDAEMRAAYARAWLFSLPVRTIGSDVEGFGLVYLEAALADLPAIGGANSGAADAIVPGETGLLVDGTSSAAVAAAVVELLADPDRAQRMGVCGRERVLRDFTWQRSAADLASVLAIPVPTEPAKRQETSAPV